MSGVEQQGGHPSGTPEPGGPPVQEGAGDDAAGSGRRTPRYRFGPEHMPTRADTWEARVLTIYALPRARAVLGLHKWADMASVMGMEWRHLYGARHGYRSCGPSWARLLTAIISKAERLKTNEEDLQREITALKARIRALQAEQNTGEAVENTGEAVG